MQKTSQQAGASSQVALAFSHFNLWDFILANYWAPDVCYELCQLTRSHCVRMRISTHSTSEWMCFFKWTEQEGGQEHGRISDGILDATSDKQSAFFHTFWQPYISACPLPWLYISQKPALHGRPHQGKWKQGRMLGMIQKVQFMGGNHWTGSCLLSPNDRPKLARAGSGRQSRLEWFTADEYRDQKCKMCDSESWVSLTAHVSPRSKVLVTQ